MVQNSSNLLKEFWGGFFLYWNSEIESGYMQMWTMQLFKAVKKLLGALL